MATETKEKKTTKKTTPKKVIKKTSTRISKKKVTTKKTKPQDQTRIIQAENNYKNTIIAAIAIAIIFIVGILLIQALANQNSEADYVPTLDEETFKKDYESLNGTSINKVEIIKNNNIVYIDMKQAAEKLESGSGVIYFGFASCEECRLAVPILLDAMSYSELETIYYVDLTKEENLRDEYVLNDKNKAKIVKAASVEYTSVRLALANYLKDYVLTTNKGKKVNTGQKRVKDLTVVSVVNGEILGFHEGIVNNYNVKDGKMNKEQEKELFDSYTQVISSQLNKKCTIKEGC